jgi:hypothetical protein
MLLIACRYIIAQTPAVCYFLGENKKIFSFSGNPKIYAVLHHFRLLHGKKG